MQPLENKNIVRTQTQEIFFPLIVSELCVMLTEFNKSINILIIIIKNHHWVWSTFVAFSATLNQLVWSNNYCLDSLWSHASLQLGPLLMKLTFLEVSQVTIVLLIHFSPKRHCKNFERTKYLVHAVTWKLGLATETPQVASTNCKGCSSEMLRALLGVKQAVQWNVCWSAIKKLKNPKPVGKNAGSKGTNNQYCCCANIINMFTFQVQIL